MVAPNVFETIAREPYIRHNRSVIAGRLADDYLHRHGVRPNVRFELEGIESIARLVSEGLGVSVLPDWAVPGPVDPSVRRWPLPAPFPSRDVGVVWTRASARSALVKLFVDLARTQVKTDAVDDAAGAAGKIGDHRQVADGQQRRVVALVQHVRRLRRSRSEPAPARRPSG